MAWLGVYFKKTLAATQKVKGSQASGQEMGDNKTG